MSKTIVVTLMSLAAMSSAFTQSSDMQVIRGFSIDRYEVSIDQFAAFVAATGTQTAAERAGGGSTYEGGWVQRKGWTWRMPYGLPANPKEPAVHTTYHEAKAFCQWAGKRLPTDSEWTEAAYTERRTSPSSGFATGQTYPYPIGPSPIGANCLRDCGTTQTPAAYASPAVTSRGKGHAVVGSTRVGVNGLFDMGANVWEWTSGGSDAARPTRGGSWWYGAAQMHRDHVQSKPANTAVVYIGFRCAKSL